MLNIKKEVRKQVVDFENTQVVSPGKMVLLKSVKQ